MQTEPKFKVGDRVLYGPGSLLHEVIGIDERENLNVYWIKRDFYREIESPIYATVLESELSHAE